MFKSIEFPPRENNNGAAGEAIVDVVEQSHDDDRSLRRRQSVESHPLALQAEKSASSEEPSICTIFRDQLYRIGLPGKLILGDYFQENMNSRRLFSY